METSTKDINKRRKNSKSFHFLALLPHFITVALIINYEQQQQLAVMGGGGEVRLEFLDDLDRDSALVDGKFLKYQASTKTFVGADASGESTKTLDSVLGDGNSSTKGMSVGVLTATNAFITGDLNVTGDLVYDEVTGRNINITGVGTVTKLHVGVATDGIYPHSFVGAGHSEF